MPVQTIYHIDTSGKTDLFVFPVTQLLTDWDVYKVPLIENEAPNTGLYQAQVNDALGDEWAVFEGATQPAGFEFSLSTVTLDPPTTSSSQSGGSGSESTFVGPTEDLEPLTSRAEMERVFGYSGMELQLDDLTPENATALLNECISEASGLVYMYALSRYTYESVKVNDVLRRWATYGALTLLSNRRGQPELDVYRNVWDDAEERLKQITIGELAQLKPPGLVEVERTSIAYIGFQHQPGPHPYAEPVRVDREASTNKFPGGRPSRWGASIGISGQLGG